MNDPQNPYVSSQGFEYGVKHFYTPTHAYLVDILIEIIGIEQTEVDHLLNIGAVYVDNYRQIENKKVKAGLLCRVHTKPRRYNCFYDWKSLVVYENKDFIILNKPAGLPSHPSVDNRLENSLTQSAFALQTNLFITHRLDTLTSGLIVYAKNNQFVKDFNVQLQSHATEKKYVALVETKQILPKKIIHYMEPSKRAPKKVLPHVVENWAMCELEIIEQKLMSNYSWVKINLLTGRTHQIRAQLSASGAPLVGDKMYGALQPYLNEAIALRACELSFNYNAQRVFFNLPDQFDDSIFF